MLEGWSRDGKGYRNNRNESGRSCVGNVNGVGSGSDASGSAVDDADRGASGVGDSVGDADADTGGGSAQPLHGARPAGAGRGAGL